MKKDSSENKLWLVGGGVTLLIIAGWISTYYILRDNTPEDRGTLGDMFGTINALFSGLALAGIIFTILLQRKELGYQRDELKATREEFIIQNKTLRFQRFENTFFNLLSLHHQIVQGIDTDVIKEKPRQAFTPTANKEYETITLQQRDVFKEKYKLLKEYIPEKEDIGLSNAYLNIYSTVQTDFGHYFRNLYRIIKFVHETEFYSIEEIKSDYVDKSDEEIKSIYTIKNHKHRYEYTSMIRAQLSDYELLWLFYNCLSTNGKDKFKPLIEKYSILKNLPSEELHDENLLVEYSESAFRKQ